MRPSGISSLRTPKVGAEMVQARTAAHALPCDSAKLPFHSPRHNPVLSGTWLVMVGLALSLLARGVPPGRRRALIPAFFVVIT